jgi:RimJ/RimL family protein N-acetyltransferase
LKVAEPKAAFDGRGGPARRATAALGISGEFALASQKEGLVADIHELRTERLILRAWTLPDRESFADLNADPRVMKHFPETLSREESDAMADRMEAHLTHYGFGFWAVEVPGTAPFIGFIGLVVPRFDAHFTPCVEVGWRLGAQFWNLGYATEGAHAALRFGFESLRLAEIVSMTVPGNLASRRVMEKIGMVRSAEDDFDHPLLPADHPLRRHVLYRKQNDWITDGVFYPPPARRL